MYLRVLRALSLFVVVVIASCGSSHSPTGVRTSAPSRASTKSDTADEIDNVKPEGPWSLVLSGSSAGREWKLFSTGASDGGVCQSIEFIRDSTTTSLDRKTAEALDLLDGKPESCGPRPAVRSIRVAPIQFTWGAGAAGGESYVAGVRAKAVSDIRVTAAAGDYDAVVGDQGAFYVPTGSSRGQTISFSIDAVRYRCGIDWPGGDPADACDTPLP